jgi:hypothetical protein
VTDPLLRMLANLPQEEPNRERAARVRSQCHAALGRSRPRTERPDGRSRLRETLLLGLGAAYLIETVREALLLSGIV